MIDIKEIEARAAKATNGSWYEENRKIYSPAGNLVLDAASGLCSKGDTDFITHARQDIPALIEKVEELQNSIIIATDGIENCTDIEVLKTYMRELRQEAQKGTTNGH